jgi:O-antigen ligase
MTTLSEKGRTRSLAARLTGKGKSPIERAGRTLLWLVGISCVMGAAVGFPYAILAISAIAFVAAIAGLRKPHLGTLGIAILCTIDVVSRIFLFGGGFLPWNTFNYLLLLMMAVSFSTLMKVRDVQSGLLVAFVTVLALWLVLTPEEGLDPGINAVLNVVIAFGILMTFMRTAGDDAAWYWQALLSSATAALVGLLYYMQFDRLPEINYNAWAYVPLTGLFAICMGLDSAAKYPRGQMLLALLAIVNVLWVFLSTSRGGLIVALICFVFIMVRLRTFRDRGIVLGILAVAALVAVVKFSDLNSRSLERLDKLLDDEEGLAARTSGRSDLALGAWLIFEENPLGVGTGGFRQAWKHLGFQEEMSGYGYGRRKAAHSGWLATLAENGIPGVLILGAYVLSFTFAGLGKGRKGLLANGLLVTLVFAAGLVTTEFVAKGLWYLAAGTTVMLHYRFPRGASALRTSRPPLRGWRTLPPVQRPGTVHE